MFGRLATLSSFKPTPWHSFQSTTKVALQNIISKRTIYTLRGLPYNSDEGVAPVLTKRALELHYKGHAVRVINHANDMVQGEHPIDLFTKVEALAESKKDAKQFFRYQCIGHVLNHDLYFASIVPGGEPMSSVMTEIIIDNFRSVQEFKSRFIRTANSLMGSGWVFLVVREGRLEILTTREGGTTFGDPTIFPLLALDLWEHAYVYDFHENREEYVNKFWLAIDWGAVEKRLKEIPRDVW